MLPKDFPKESPVIRLPEDSERISRLRFKLAEYDARIDLRIRLTQERIPGIPTEYLINLHKKGHLDYYKRTVLEELLEKGQIVTWDMARRLAKEMGNLYNCILFSEACGIINDYCNTGGKNCRDGTGLSNTRLWFGV
jgi:hypothetical protein